MRACLACLVWTHPSPRSSTGEPGIRAASQVPSLHAAEVRVVPERQRTAPLGHGVDGQTLDDSEQGRDRSPELVAAPQTAGGADRKHRVTSRAAFHDRLLIVLRPAADCRGDAGYSASVESSPHRAMAGPCPAGGSSAGGVPERRSSRHAGRWIPPGCAGRPGSCGSRHATWPPAFSRRPDFRLIRARAR